MEPAGGPNRRDTKWSGFLVFSARQPRATAREIYQSSIIQQKCHVTRSLRPHHPDRHNDTSKPSCEHPTVPRKRRHKPVCISCRKDYSSFCLYLSRKTGLPSTVALSSALLEQSGAAPTGQHPTTNDPSAEDKGADPCTLTGPVVSHTQARVYIHCVFVGPRSSTPRGHIRRSDTASLLDSVVSVREPASKNTTAPRRESEGTPEIWAGKARTTAEGKEQEARERPGVVEKRAAEERSHERARTEAEPTCAQPTQRERKQAKHTASGSAARCARYQMPADVCEH